MKRIIAFSLAALLILMFAGCVASDVGESSAPAESKGGSATLTDSSAEGGISGTESGGVSDTESFTESSVPGSDTSAGSDSSAESFVIPGVNMHSYAEYDPDNSIIEGLFSGDAEYDFEEDLINILLIGSDARGQSTDGTRSDTMIILSINRDKETITLTSVMRDLYVPIPGHKDNRINAAYSAGGPKLLMQTISENLGIKLDYYAMVGFSSFQTAVDALGGLRLTVNEDNYNHFCNYPELAGLSKEEATDGTHVLLLDGATALYYARDRKYPSADMVRTLHQRDLLSQFIANCRGSSLSELHGMLQIVLPYVTTNIPKDMLKKMVLEAIDYVDYDLSTARIPCAKSFEFATERGMSVIKADMEMNKKYLYALIFGE